MPWDAKDDEDVQHFKKTLDTRDEMNYLEGILEGIDQVMNNYNDTDYVYNLWHEVRGKLDDAYDKAKELGMKVEKDND